MSDIVDKLNDQAQAPALHDLCTEAAAEILRLQELISQLNNYVEHGWNCDTKHGKLRSCSCGLDKLSERWEY